MTARTTLRAMVIASAAILLLAPPVLADTCCPNLPVDIEPTVTRPGAMVRLVGLECRNADNSGPLPLDLGTFWLATTDRPAEGDPDTTPGEGPPDFPPVEEWHAFDSVAAGASGVAAPGDATITVPELSDGRYQLWWWCDDGSGPGGGIHYSTGPRLVVGTVPDTATASPTSPGPAEGPSGLAGFVLGLGSVVFLWFLRHPMPNARHRGR
jgi:hypothetical protein